MKSAQIGAAPRAPVTPRPWVSRMLTARSNPAHTDTLSVGVKPVNQTSLKSSVVPVLPAAGRANPIWRITLPVPSSSTARIMSTT